jgi:YHS domain-containing protein
MRTIHAVLIGLGLLAAALAGCSADHAVTTAVKKETHEPNQHEDGEHAHAPSAHGGIIVEIGRDNYHLEAVFEKGGKLKLYMLGRDETKVQDVETQTLAAYVKAEGDAEAAPIEAKPEPQPGDKPGATSLFVAELPKSLAGKRVEVTIPALRVEGERFRVAFKSSPPAETSDHGMPAKVDDAEERKLYLTPGGKYTEADVKANGNVVASEKFKGIKATHDVKPKPGDKLCPISMTKANPKFSWVIGGKTYEFCCPPCVDEFVAMAKEKPDEIKEPEFYLKK